MSSAPHTVTRPGLLPLPARPVAVEPSLGATGALGPTGPLAPGDLSELLAAFNDVTARLEATHAALRAEVSRLNDELREANERLQRSKRLAALGEMAAGIAHEIRNPLGAIGLDARMLERELCVGPADEHAVAARRIGAAVRRLDAIVGDVLSFAKEARVNREPTPIAGLFADAVAACEAETARSGPRRPVVEVLWPRGAPRVMDVDPLLAHRALVNVLLNAVQAVAEGAEAGPPGAAPVPAVRVFARRVVETDGQGRRVPMVALVVRDNGPGIPPGVRERMFNPFFTTRATGTGLGLAIVHRLVEAHGGRVVVRNNDEGLPGVRVADAHAAERSGATVELHFPEMGAVSERSARHGLRDGSHHPAARAQRGARPGIAEAPTGPEGRPGQLTAAGAAALGDTTP